MHPRLVGQGKSNRARAALLAFHLVAAAALVLGGCATELAGPDAVGERAGARPAEPGRTTHEPSGAANFVAAGGRFEVWFPAQPRVRDKDEEGASGKLYSLERNGKRYFAGYVSHGHERMSELALRRAVRTTAERLEGRIVREEPIWFAGYVGREFMLREPAESRTLARYYSLGDTLYMTRFTTDDESFSLQEARAFLDSFNILALPGAKVSAGVDAENPDIDPGLTRGVAPPAGGVLDEAPPK